MPRKSLPFDNFPMEYFFIAADRYFDRKEMDGNPFERPFPCSKVSLAEGNYLAYSHRAAPVTLRDMQW